MIVNILFGGLFLLYLQAIERLLLQVASSPAIFRLIFNEMNIIR